MPTPLPHPTEPRRVLTELQLYSDTILLWQVVPYLEVTAQLCADFSIECLDQAALLDREHYLDPTNWAGWEGIHPNDAGQQLMADAVVRVVPEPPAVAMLAVAVGVLAVVGNRSEAVAR